jgi:hypothetical protein
MKKLFVIVTVLPILISASSLKQDDELQQEHERWDVKTITDGFNPDEITIIGVLFQDKFHKPDRLRIRNFLEVHPILLISSNSL